MKIVILKISLFFDPGQIIVFEGYLHTVTVKGNPDWCAALLADYRRKELSTSKRLGILCIITGAVLYKSKETEIHRV